MKKILLFSLLFFTTAVLSDNRAELKTTQYFNTIKNDPALLNIFLQDMPKGGDLHHHRSGAAYAENLISYGMNDGLCIDPDNFSVTKKTACAPDNQLAHIALNSQLYNHLIDAWSMRNVKASRENPHDHFFNTFLKFIPISNNHRTQTLTEVVNRAGKQHEIYLETMITNPAEPGILLAEKATWHSDLSKNFDELKSLGIDNASKKITQDLTLEQKALKKILRCDSQTPAPGCQVTQKYQALALRNMPPMLVFSQLLLAFEVAQQNPAVVAVNLVGPEDGYFSLRDYHLHMQMIHFLKQKYPTVNLSLHAGELAFGLTPPDTPQDHIRDAIETGEAERIGHGVDIGYENNTESLLTMMAKKHIPVEINLTSNDKILDIKGSQHPIMLYLQHGVPIVLATDDEGVLRTDLSHEYARAILDYQLDYPTIKKIVRNSLTYSFADGKSLWIDPDKFKPVNICEEALLSQNPPKGACNQFLKQNEKARLQWQLEEQFNQFERRINV